jgi:general secretion pathway protein D
MGRQNVSEGKFEMEKFIGQRASERFAFKWGASGLALMLVVTGCASSKAPPPIRADIGAVGIGNGLVRPDRPTSDGETVTDKDDGVASRTSQRSQIEIPPLSETEEGLEGLGDPAIARPVPRVKTVNAVTPALPVPEFIDVVFGQMAGVPYTTGPGVAERTDLVQLRSSGNMSTDAFLDLVSNALESYGLRVVPGEAAYEIVTDSTLESRVPRFIKSRSRVEVPADMRPIVQFVELNAIAANEMDAILKQAFPGKDGLKTEPNPRLNVVTLTGFREDVDAALSVIDQLDELAYAGSKAERYSPVFWSAGQLAAELVSLLEAEGWQASSNKAIQKSILVLPVEYSNDIFVFSRSELGLARAKFWINELDRASRKGDSPQIYLYPVQNVDAELLAATVNQVLARGTRSASNIEPAIGAPGANVRAPQDDASGPSGHLVVDKMSNQIIFSGTPSQYGQIRPLLKQLDTPSAEVLIEVTVAEITLNDATRYGVEFFIDSLGNSDFKGTVDNSGLGLGGDGTNISILTGNVNAAINFFANNNMLDVLSTPHLVARSGGSAQIQVGSDVPIITSQRASDAQDGVGNTDVLQSVDYRSTGVLLSIEPIVFGDNRIDLSITQEVSTAIATTTSQIASPTISNRSVTTQLSLEDGATAVLGGLIQNTTTRDETGTPILKDLPGVGNLFRNTNVTQNRTELLVLITAYVIRGTEDKRSFTKEFVDRFNDAQTNSQQMETYRGAYPDYVARQKALAPNTAE